MNRHTCKIYAKMTHNVMVGYYRAGQNALIFNLTSEMNSSCPITFALLLRSVQTQKMHIIYIILSLHAKNQPPWTMQSYVYTLFKFPGE